MKKSMLSSWFLGIAISVIATSALAWPMKTIVYKGHQTEPLGATVLTPTGTSLTVSNIGSSGNDGVYVLLGYSGHSELAFNKYDVTTTPTGSYLEATATGRLNGASGSGLGSSRITDQGSSLTISGNFGVSAAPRPYRVVVTAANVVVFDSTYSAPAATNLASVGRWPIGSHKGPIGAGPSTPCFAWPFDAQIPMTLAGGRVVTGDYIRILDNTGNLTSGLQSYSVLGANVPSLVITNDVETVPPVLPAVGPQGLALLALMLGGLGYFVLKNGRNQRLA